MFERDPEESRQLTAGTAVAPEFSPKVASQKGAHGQNWMPGCAGASASAANDGLELQGVRGRLGSRSWEIWSPDAGQLDAERLTASPWPQNSHLKPAGCIWSCCLWTQFWFTFTKEIL